MNERKILDFARKSVYDKVKYLGKWNDFDVWEPGFSDGETRFTGFPQFILAKEGNLRWSEVDAESRLIMEKLWK